MRKFIEYIDEYYTCFKKVDDEVKNAIFEKMVVDKISPFSEEEIFQSMIEVRQKLNVKKQVDFPALAI